MTPDEEFNSLPQAVLRLCQFYMDGGFGKRSADWLTMFNEYVDLTRAVRADEPVSYRITAAGREHLDGKAGGE